MGARFDAIHALLLSPFIALCCVAIAVAVVYIARHDKATARTRRNLYAPSPATVAARNAHQARAGMGE